MLPSYAPPATQRLNVAAGAAPLLVLLGFTLIVVRAIDPSTGLALFAACTIWVCHEAFAYQRGLDGYNHDYAQRHLVWRSEPALRNLIQSPEADPATRTFIQAYLDAGRVVLLDGQRA